MGVHGGDIYRHHVSIDFSVNVNPSGAPECVKEALFRAVEDCGRYPDIEMERLKTAVGNALAVPAEYLLFGNGASELFMAVVHGLRPKKTVIPAPSFYGYEYAAKAAGSEIIFFEMSKEERFCLTKRSAKELEKVLTEDVELLFLASPNNPVGNLPDRETLCALLRHCREKGIYVVLDECFIEFCGQQNSMLSEWKRAEIFDHLILVRAYTKIFAVPGVRLGYLICENRRLRRRIAGQLPEWNLSCFAQEAGIVCAGQKAFITETENHIKRERKFMEEELGRKGLEVYPSAANFIMVYSKEPLYETLLGRGILIRDCSNFKGLGKGFYRIAVRNREENEILLENL